MGKNMKSDVLDLIKSDSHLSLPTDVSKDKNYRSDLKSKFIRFNQILDKATKGNDVDSYIHENKSKINVICNLLLRCIDEYLLGHRANSYKIIEKIFKLPIITEQISELKLKLEKNTNYYRVRLDKKIKDKKDNFHISFNERHLVGAQRYSVPGLPCLYLGSSIYLCWKEMGEPDLNSLYISRYVIHKYSDKKVLNFAFDHDLAFTINDFLFEDPADLKDKNIKRSIARIIFYPILLACSYNRKEKDAKFHIEYCIPNLIMEWVLKSKDFDGVAFFSTKINRSKLSVNYVFPTKYERTKSDFCPVLTNKFELSDPISWQVLSSVKNYTAPSKKPDEIIGMDEKIHEILNAKYSDTGFYEISKQLNEYKTDTINSSII